MFGATKKCFVVGEVVGPRGCVFIEEVEPFLKKRGERIEKVRQGKFKCSICDDFFVGVIWRVSSGDKSNCGCMSNRERPRKWDGLASRIGGQRHPLYNVWTQMVKRCHSPSHASFKRYGGRGIFVCDEWRNDFKLFFDWAIDAGWRKGLQIDRKNNNDGYSPFNCRFVTIKENCNNRRTNRYCILNGEKLTFAEAVEKYGFSRDSLKAWDKGIGLKSKPLGLLIVPKENEPC